MANESFTNEGKSIDEKFEQQLSDSETNDLVDVGVSIGTDFLQGMAMNSPITVEQKMSLKAMKSIIDSMATTASIVPTDATQAHQAITPSAAPATEQDLGSLQGILGDLL